MKTKDNNNTKKIIIISLAFIILLLTFVIYNYAFIKNNSYAMQTSANDENFKISNAQKVDIEKIIAQNTNISKKEDTEVKNETLEYITKYKTNTNLPKGTMQVIQEGREGIQQITIKKVYDGENLINEEQIEAKVIKASVDKIVEIGGANYTDNYKVKVGDKVNVTSDRILVMVEPNSESQKVATLGQGEELKILEIYDEWYRISSSSTTGWVKKENTIYINPNAGANNIQKSTKNKQTILSDLNFNMNLNKPSGLSLEQFKKVLTDEKDKNKIFSNNAEYFYYIEKQYSINGIFIASIGIHESAWGTSKIAKDKNNLFGYGAYDSNPYNGAYTFSNYSESIDLMARVLTKYYLNPKGTKIYNSEVALGTYYNGATLSGVNKRYATDKNWANGVYNNMKYLCNKL